MIYLDKSRNCCVHTGEGRDVTDTIAMLAHVKWVFLDFDGVFVDSLAALTMFANRALSKMGSPRHEESSFPIYATDDDALSAPVMSWEGCATHLGCTPEQATVYAQHCIAMVEEDTTIHPLEGGMQSCLEQLALRGRGVNVLTGSATRYVEYLLRHYRLRSLIHDVLGRPDSRNRSKDQILRDFLHDHRLDPSQVVMVGDTTSDTRAAKAAGVISIATTWGVHGISSLQDADPDLFAHDPEQLCALLTIDRRKLPKLESLGAI